MAEGLPPRIGAYETVTQLALGGMARVIVARRGPEEPLVALKLVLPELAEDPEYRTMFLDEARINSRIRHLNVVAVLDVDRDERTHILFMVMELVLGATLSQVARGGALPTGVVLELVAQAADGLHAAHRATAPDGTPLSLVHRDVSPQNLLVGLDGVLRVSDFGVARATQRLTRTRTGQFKGKLEYCSPEQALGIALDARSDLFALGIVAWELLSGARLVPGGMPFEQMEVILHATFRSARELRPDVPAQAAAVLDAMLARDREARPRSAEHVARVLRGAIAEASLDASSELIAGAARGAASPTVLRLAGLEDEIREQEPEGPGAEPETRVAVPRPRDD